MDFVKEWTLCVCVTLIISIILSVLAPNGKLSRFYKTIISIFIFLSFLYPFTTTNFSFDRDYFEDIKIEEQANDISENFVNIKVNDFLLSQDIIGASVSSNVTLENDVITINDLQIAVPSEYDIDDVSTLVYDNLSLNARVIHIGD